MQNLARIPKKIHYIWLGHGEKSDLINSCIDNTKKTMDDWEIIEWNEDNIDIEKCKYAQEAYNAGKYAFAADYARFEILYKYGGVYLDTDVELLKKIPDYLLKEKGFTGVEANNRIAPGLIFGVEAQNPLVKEILEYYENEKYLLEDGSFNKKTVVDIVTEVFCQHGFSINGEKQDVEGIYVYPSEYFCAYDFVTKEFNITDNTISIHHYTATWTDWQSRLKKSIQDVLLKVLGKKLYIKIISFKRKIFGVHGE